MIVDLPEHQDPDVPRLMEAIRRLIRESGGAVPTPEEEAAAVTGRLEALITETRIRPALLEEMLQDGEQWNITGRFSLAGHRPGIAGRVVGWTKMVLRRAGVLLGNPLVYRQAEINSYLRTVIHYLLLESVRTERKMAHLERVLRARGGSDADGLRSEALDRIDRLVAASDDGGEPGGGGQ
jgi:hypothetical protein